MHRGKLTCTEVQEFGGAYALGALPAEELQAVQSHLNACSWCAADFAALQDVAVRLSYAVQEETPPPELLANILARARAEGVQAPHAPRRR